MRSMAESLPIWSLQSREESHPDNWAFQYQAVGPITGDTQNW